MRFLLICAVVFFTTAPIWAQLERPPERTTLDKIVATLGDKYIMLSDVAENIRAAAKQSKDKALPEDFPCYVLDQLLTQKLLLMEAEKDSIEITDEEVQEQLDARINEIIQRMGNDTTQFVEYYSLSPSQMKEKFRSDMRENMLIERMRDKIVASVTITPSEVKAHFALVPKDSLPYFNAEVELSQFSLKPEVSPEEDMAARKLAEEIRRRIVEEKGDFCELAKMYSEDGSKMDCGNLGLAPRGSFVPEFESAGMRLKEGETSPVVKSAFGYHIIQLVERRGNFYNYRHILVSPDITSVDRDKALHTIDSIRTLINKKSISFEDAFRKFTKDENVRNQGSAMTNPQTGDTYFELDQLDPDIFFTIDTMKVGEVSQPLEILQPNGETHYYIVRLNSRTEPHTANLQQDYPRIQRAALEEKKAKEISRWVSEKISDNFINVAEEFLPCPNLQIWLKKQ